MPELPEPELTEPELTEMPELTKMISITKKRYYDLLIAEEVLDMLEFYHVDEWENYEDAMAGIDDFQDETWTAIMKPKEEPKERAKESTMTEKECEFGTEETHFIKAFQKVQTSVHENAVAKGFWENTFKEEVDACKIALMHSELSEALEAMRKGDKESKKVPQISHIAEELADTVIRIMDFAEARKMNIGEAIIRKSRYNTGRSFMHGGKKF